MEKPPHTMARLPNEPRYLYRIRILERLRNSILIALRSQPSDCRYELREMEMAGLIMRSRNRIALTSTGFRFLEDANDPRMLLRLAAEEAESA